MRYVVGVMGPAKARRRDIDNARLLGELIARREWILLTGGRDVGVMDAASQGAKRVARSMTVGILPSAKDRVSRHVDVAVITEMGNARNNICVMSSHVVVACGLGGAGTVSEVALALKAGKPVILVGVTPAEAKFVKRLGRRLVAAVETPEEAVNLIMKRLERTDDSSSEGVRSWATV
ncbi:MAG TPA: hypothetical protein VHF07_04745 [Nitrospiraceae bacterium]|nr:hypothetical protein [Nitrospiraceae bacterium]